MAHDGSGAAARWIVHAISSRPFPSSPTVHTHTLQNTGGAWACRNATADATSAPMRTRSLQPRTDAGAGAGAAAGDKAAPAPALGRCWCNMRSTRVVVVVAVVARWAKSYTSNDCRCGETGWWWRVRHVRKQHARSNLRCCRPP